MPGGFRAEVGRFRAALNAQRVGRSCKRALRPQGAADAGEAVQVGLAEDVGSGDGGIRDLGDVPRIKLPVPLNVPRRQSVIHIDMKRNGLIADDVIQREAMNWKYERRLAASRIFDNGPLDNQFGYTRGTARGTAFRTALGAFFAAGSPSRSLGRGAAALDVHADVLQAHRLHPMMPDLPIV